MLFEAFRGCFFNHKRKAIIIYHYCLMACPKRKISVYSRLINHWLTVLVLSITILPINFLMDFSAKISFGMTLRTKFFHYNEFGKDKLPVDFLEVYVCVWGSLHFLSNRTRRGHFVPYLSAVLPKQCSLWKYDSSIDLPIYLNQERKSHHFLNKIIYIYLFIYSLSYFLSSCLGA